MERIQGVTLLSAVLTLLIGLLGYLLVTIVTIRYKDMRTSSNLLVVTMGVFDVILVAVANPLSLFHTNEANGFVPGVTSPQTLIKWIDRCDVIQGITTFGVTGHVVCMLVLAVFRTCSSLPKEKFTIRAGKRFCVVVCLLIIIISAVYASVAIATSSKIILGELCWFSTRIDDLYNKAIWVPLLALTFISFILFYVAFGCMTHLGTCSYDTSDQEGQGQATSQSEVRNQVSRAVILFTVFFIPSYLTHYIIMMRAGQHGVQYYERWVYHVTVWVNNVHLCINPVIYIRVHSGVRGAIKRLIMRTSPASVQPASVEPAPVPPSEGVTPNGAGAP